MDANSVLPSKGCSRRTQFTTWSGWKRQQDVKTVRPYPFIETNQFWFRWLGATLAPSSPERHPLEDSASEDFPLFCLAGKEIRAKRIQRQ
ncbi:hypothetical protein C0Q70_01951 [Pomacea canaliculata]|uniref:Uncharacterized protein n=1 Tax=Pomacea canaliculata TaxID=400727 RepID=A0A2T7Q0X4_POMCA|nr:hypothetical protein C0Q70_01951 [Pomacea canaliculata]